MFVFLGYQKDIDKNIYIKYDVALVKLESSFEFDKYVNPICLPPNRMTPDDLTDSMKLIINGFGGFNGSYQYSPNHKYFNKVGVAENSKYI